MCLKLYMIKCSEFFLTTWGSSPPHMPILIRTHIEGGTGDCPTHLSTRPNTPIQFLTHCGGAGLEVQPEPRVNVVQLWPTWTIHHPATMRKQSEAGCPTMEKEGALSRGPDKTRHLQERDCSTCFPSPVPPVSFDSGPAPWMICLMVANNMNNKINNWNKTQTLLFKEHTTLKATAKIQTKAKPSQVPLKPTLISQYLHVL